MVLAPTSRLHTGFLITLNKPSAVPYIRHLLIPPVCDWALNTLLTATPMHSPMQPKHLAVPTDAFVLTHKLQWQ